MGEILWDKQSKFFRNLLVSNSSFYGPPFGGISGTEGGEVILRDLAALI
jgi:hypothetical protein